MTDHDQRFKTLLRAFLPDFFELFFPAFARLFDFSQIEWLDKEVFPDPPEGQRHAADLVAKLALARADSPPEETSPQEMSAKEALLALIHIEVESRDSSAPIQGRMPWYYLNLRQTHRLPVLPIVLFLRVGLEGIGTRVHEERFGSLVTLRFECLSVGLPALDAVEYLERGNDLGVALSSLMRVPANQRARHKAESLQRLAKSTQDELHRYLLSECVETYLRLSTAQEQEEFDRLLNTPPYQEAKQMAATYFEKGLEEGLEKGLEKGRLEGEKKGQREMLALVLEERFGPLAPAVRERVEEWPSDDLPNLARRAVHAASLAELGLEE